LAGDGKQQQRVECPGLAILPGQEAVGRQNDQNADPHHQHAEEGGETIHHQHAAKGRAGAGGAGDGSGDSGNQSQQGQMAEQRRRAPFHQRIEHHDQRAGDDQQDFRQKAQNVGGGGHGASGHGSPPPDGEAPPGRAR
jgi:hypothetical protein